MFTTRKIAPACFHVSLVQPCETDTKQGMPGQRAARGDLRAKQGRVIRGTDDGRDVLARKFKRIWAMEKLANERWHYKVEWVDHNPT